MTALKFLFVGCASLLLVLLALGPVGAGPLDAPGATKVLACSACHGFGGASPGDAVPILAGIRADYFKKAIQDYASGKRPSPEMEPYAKMVIQFGLDDIAAYFAGQAKQPTPIKADPAAVARGKTASTQCVICHGAEGKGDAARGIPDISGQPPGYLRNQMLLFKQERRSSGDQALNALKALMKTIPNEEVADLAAYYSSLR